MVNSDVLLYFKYRHRINNHIKSLLILTKLLGLPLGLDMSYFLTSFKPETDVIRIITITCPWNSCDFHGCKNNNF